MSVKLASVWPLGAVVVAALAALAIACGGGGDAERTIVIRRPSPTADAGVTVTPTPARSPPAGGRGRRHVERCAAGAEGWPDRAARARHQRAPGPVRDGHPAKRPERSGPGLHLG